MANMELDESFQALTDTEMWMDALVVLVGYLVPAVLKMLIDSRYDLPDEVYGLGTIAGAQVAAPDGYKRTAQIGAGMHVVVSAGNRSEQVSQWLPNSPVVGGDA